MKIELEREPPRKGAIYALSPLEKQAVSEFLEENEAKGWIRRSESEYAMPVFCVGKKDAGARMVIDYRPINNVCKIEPDPIPIMHTLPDELGKAKWFTTLDLRAGYNNIRIRPGDEKYAAFRTHKGTYEPLVMQFGMMNSPAVFQRAMNELLSEMIGQGVVV